MKHRSVVPETLFVGAVCAFWLAGQAGCRSSNAGPKANGSAVEGGAAGPNWLTRRTPLPAQDLPHPAPLPSHADLTPKPSRDPDWDLSTEDPARDYATRYAFFTKRYGDGFACVEFGASRWDHDRQRVEAKTAANCPGAGTLRDVFIVDVAGDRLTVDDKNIRSPLAHWPDGSDPESPATVAVREIDEMQEWKTPLRDAFRRELLVPVRVQAYGRGTYPVVSVAGWHGAAKQGVALEAIQTFVADLCAANQGMPLGVMAATDRTRILRVRCPPAIKWETL